MQQQIQVISVSQYFMLISFMSCMMCCYFHNTQNLQILFYA